VSGIYRKKVERLTEALNTPEDRNEAAEAIWALVEKITLRPGPNRGEIDATLQGELGTILGQTEPPETSVTDGSGHRGYTFRFCSAGGVDAVESEFR
jgi:hypothetical protein